MKRESKKSICIGISLIVAFLLWTAAIQLIDVQAIGPRETVVGFATMNRLVHNLTGVHMSLYTITDWLGLVPFGVVLGFALLGLIQWIQRRHFLKVDYDILILGAFYIVVMAVYILFEILVVNFRPVLINGYLEASYPSSTTMLVMCVMPTTAMQIQWRTKNNILNRMLILLIAAFIGFMVIGRLISGVHWITDIIGGAVLSAGLVQLYHGILKLK